MTVIDRPSLWSTDRAPAEVSKQPVKLYSGDLQKLDEACLRFNEKVSRQAQQFCVIRATQASCARVLSFALDHLLQVLSCNSAQKRKKERKKTKKKKKKGKERRRKEEKEKKKRKKEKKIRKEKRKKEKKKKRRKEKRKKEGKKKESKKKKKMKKERKKERKTKEEEEKEKRRKERKKERKKERNKQQQQQQLNSWNVCEKEPPRPFLVTHQRRSPSVIFL